MFGKNKLEKNRGAFDGRTLQVVEIFHTIQGEGPSAGTPAIFIRLAGCNLACTFCDTDFETGAEELNTTEVLSRVAEVCSNWERPLIVITGGEPMRQNIAPLIEELVCLGYKVEIETAGTLVPYAMASVFSQHCPSDTVRVICSPKTQHIHRGIEEHCYNYKYIVSQGDRCDDAGAPITNTQGGVKLTLLYRPPAFNDLLNKHTTIFVQPMEVYKQAGRWGLLMGRAPMIPDYVNTLANHDYAVKIALKFGYRISVQIHKVLGLR